MIVLNQVNMNTVWEIWFCKKTLLQSYIQKITDIKQEVKFQNESDIWKWKVRDYQMCILGEKAIKIGGDGHMQKTHSKFIREICGVKGLYSPDNTSTFWCIIFFTSSWIFWNFFCWKKSDWYFNKHNYFLIGRVRAY